MTWEELRLLLQSFKDEGMKLDGIVRIHSNDMLEPLDLVQSMTTDNLHLVVSWDVEGNDDGG